MLNWKIGSVPYLNAKPLVFGIENQTEFLVPSQLASLLRQKKLDAGLIPIAEYFENPAYHIAPSLSISSRGPVRSVFLAHKTPLAKIKSVALDPASKTSNLLLKVILSDFFQLKPQYVSPSENPDGQLYIGDPALQHRNRLLKEGYHLLDLGETWFTQTQLPFVFAIWAYHPSIPEPNQFRSHLLNIKKEGLSQIDSITKNQNILPSEAAHDYLTRCIFYDLGAREMEGIELFQKLCLGHGLILKKCDFNISQ